MPGSDVDEQELDLYNLPTQSKRDRVISPASPGWSLGLEPGGGLATRVTIRICEASFIVASGGAFLIPRGSTYFEENIADRAAKLFFTCAHEISVADANDGRTNGAIFDFEDSSDATLPSPVITLGRVAGLAAVNLVVFVQWIPEWRIIFPSQG
ncbi:hypothetical protein B0H11DRAFT_2218104 [Mycena galericulata]|nr:hypothetical protein B0H11DRAFT_2218104 [Mycena galericulata]